MVPCASHLCARAASFAASRWNTSTNSRPMILRLASGSLTPASAAQELARRIDVDHLARQVAGEHVHHLLASFRRSRPWSTNTQVSWSPMARWISAAATDESTPPDRPRMTSSSADLRADARDRLVDVVAHVPVAGAAADVEHEAGEDVALPCAVCVTSGWNCTP
jgi:hypothetical protein